MKYIWKIKTKAKKKPWLDSPKLPTPALSRRARAGGRQIERYRERETEGKTHVGQERRRGWMFEASGERDPTTRAESAPSLGGS